MIWGGPEEVHEVREQDADVAYHPQCVELGDRRGIGGRQNLWWVHDAGNIWDWKKPWPRVFAVIPIPYFRD